MGVMGVTMSDKYFDKYENTSVWLPKNERKLLMQLHIETGLSVSRILRSGLLYVLKDKEKLLEKYKDYVKIAEMREKQDLSMTKSKFLMAKEGWESRIKEVIFKWMQRHKVIPSKILCESWVKDGECLGWSNSKAKRAVDKGVNIAKLAIWKDGNTFIVDGITIKDKEKIRRQNNKLK
uniref:Uncharacterized protein n=2 Tax=viral metagenome TaxID=1070528 RepID=A0A6M3JP18_9ZZZZ